MGYNWAKEKMKKLLLIALLFLAGSVIVGNTTYQKKSQNHHFEIKITGYDVDYWVEDETDEFGNYLGITDIMVKNNLSRDVYVEVVFKENGKQNKTVGYVPAGEQKAVWHGNRTLKAISCTHSISPITL